MLGLAHLDISFNYLTMQECEILNEGLSKNQEILGIHIIGNEGITDSQGFIRPFAMTNNIEQTHLFTRLFQESRRYAKYLKTECWLCEGWVEINFSFKYERNDQHNEPIFLHLECDKYQPDLMFYTLGQYQLKRVVPPGSLCLFFTQGYNPLTSQDYQSKTLAQSLELSAHFSENKITVLKVDTINVIEASGNPCEYHFPFSTLPRKPRYDIQPRASKLLRVQ